MIRVVVVGRFVKSLRTSWKLSQLWIRSAVLAVFGKRRQIFGAKVLDVDELGRWLVEELRLFNLRSVLTSHNIGSPTCMRWKSLSCILLFVLDHQRILRHLPMHIQVWLRSIAAISRPILREGFATSRHSSYPRSWTPSIYVTLSCLGCYWSLARPEPWILIETLLIISLLLMDTLLICRIVHLVSHFPFSIRWIYELTRFFTIILLWAKPFWVSLRTKNWWRIHKGILLGDRLLLSWDFVSVAWLIVCMMSWLPSHFLFRRSRFLVFDGGLSSFWFGLEWF